MRPGPRWYGFVAIAALTVVAGLAFAPAFGGGLSSGDFAAGRLIVEVLACAVLPVAAVAACAWRRMSVLVAAWAGVLGVLVALVVARPDRQVGSGPYRLLTGALPATASGDAVASVGALLGIAALISALLAAYARAAWLAVLPQLGCLVAALALDAGVREPPEWYVIPVVAAVGLTVAALRSRPRSPRRGSLRLAASGVGMLALVAASAALASALAPSLPGVSHRPADVRRLVAAPPVHVPAVDSPLQDFAALRSDKLRVRLDGTSSSPVRLLPMVRLDQFRGTYWTTAAQYRRAGHQLSGAGGTTRLAVHLVEHWPLAWLPQPGRPSTVSIDGLAFDGDDLAVPAGQSVPTDYEITGTPLPVDSPRLNGDDPARVPALSAPAVITSFARRALAAPAGYPQLETLLRQLRGPDFYLDDRGDQAPVGNGFFQVSALLTGSGGIHAGTSEQFASAFAVLARVLGYDARVALGFRPRYGSGGAFTVAGADVYAWDEVRFARAGWVTFDPTPVAVRSQSEKTPPPQQSPAPPSPTAVPDPSPPAAQHHNAPPGHSGAAADSRSGAIAWYVLVVPVAVVGLLAVPPVAKLLRRRRRRAARSPARAVYGAWQETLDRLLESGVGVRPAATSGDVALAAPPPARPYVAALADLVDRAGYAPEPAAPGMRAVAWGHTGAVGTTLREGRHPLRRLAAWLDPRPLWRR